MSEVRPTNDDEIDLFELFQTLWDGKWLISVFVVLATLIGFGYSQIAKPKYDVSVRYTTNIYSLSIQQTCSNVGRRLECMEAEVIKRIRYWAGDSWIKKKKNSPLSFSTSSPLKQSDYQAQIEQASTALTNEVFVDATATVAIIQTEMNDTLLSTEVVATNMLNAKRVIQQIDNGQSVVTFGPVLISKSSPHVALILVSSLVLGGIAGMFFTLGRNTLAKRKKQVAKA